MPSNERANQRKEKQRKKEKTVKTIIWTVLLVILFSLIVMKICEVDFTSIKNKISPSSTISTISDNNFPYLLDSSHNSKMNIINDKLSVLTENSVSVINPNDAKSRYSFDHGFANPVSISAGNYICTYDQGNTRLRLDTTSDNLIEKNTDKSIITATVADNGTFAYATFGNDVKSILYVVSKNATAKMELEVNDGYITSIALNSRGTKCIYTTVKSKDADLITTVHTITVGKNTDTSTFDYINSNIIDVAYSSSDNAYIIGDNFVSVIKSQRKEEIVYSSGTIKTLNYCFTNSKELVINYSAYSNSSQSSIAFVRSTGRIKNTFDVQENAKFISSNANEITVLYANKFTIYSLTKGEEKDSYSCDSSVNSVYTLASRNYVQYGQYIDIID